MALDCFMVFSVICFGSLSNGEPLGTAQRDSAVAITVTGKDWSVKLDEKARLRKLARPTAMEQACKDDACIAYSRKCDSADHPTQCEYVLEIAGTLHVLSLKASDESRAKVAMDMVGVLTREMVPAPGEKMPPALALSELNKEAI
jgi:hypothetical protein